MECVDDRRLRHPNGNGSIYGNDAFVSPLTWLDPKSKVMHDAEVCCSSLWSSSVLDRGRVCQGFLKHSIVSVSGRVVGPAKLRNVSVEGRGSIVADGEPVTLIGDDEKHPLVINRRMWIHRGVWLTPPAYAEVQGAGNVIVGITRCVDNLAHVGCRCDTLDEWLKKGDDIGRAAGWSSEAVALVRKVFETWAAN